MTLRPEPYRTWNRPDLPRARGVRQEAAGASVDMSALALAWVLHHPRIDAAIVGPRTPAHLDAALAALYITLSDDEAVRLATLF